MKPYGMHPWKLAVIGAGPAGLALALQAARRLPCAQVHLYDARPLTRDVSGDPRTLALAQGSVQWLQMLDAWPAELAQPITEVRVSQAPPTLALGGRAAAVRLRAQDEGLPQLGAVLSYGALVARLQQRWQQLLAQEDAQALAADDGVANQDAADTGDRRPGSPGNLGSVGGGGAGGGGGNGIGSGAGRGAGAGSVARLVNRFGTPVQGLKNLPAAEGGGVEVDAGIVERYDLAVVAEGGVFAEQARKAVRRDYQQTAWVGSATLRGGTPGLALERFTHEGPLALLPLPPSADGQQRAALVWCVDSRDDPVASLDEAQRLVVLNERLRDLGQPATDDVSARSAGKPQLDADALPPVGELVALSPLKSFALGLNAERTLVQGRTVRIGNAAQTLHPVAGQGLNLGLRDAAALVQALRASDAATLDAQLRRLEWQRAPDRWGLIATTDFLARSFTWRWPGLSALRGLGLATLQALPPLKSALAQQMMMGRRG